MTRSSLLNATLLLAVLSLAAVGCDSGPGKPDDTGPTSDDIDGDGWPNNEDCDDEDPSIHPEGDEVCDGVDNDCDGEIDEGVSTTYYEDADEDGFGNPAVYQQACEKPEGWVTNDDDCEDANAAIFPGAEEVCDGEDNDCDGDVDEGLGSWWYRDGDDDGYGDPKNAVQACTRPPGYVPDDTDCDDRNEDIHPKAPELCDGLDNDCDGDVDEDAGTWLADDADGDGFGDPGTMAFRCEGVDNEWDCDDADPSEPVVVDAATGSPTGAGTLSSPLDSVQDGVDRATECVVVFAGTYHEAVHLNGDDLWLTGVEGSGSTILDGTGLGVPVLTIDRGETSATVVSGFTLTGGDGNLTVDSESHGCMCGETCTDWYYTYCGGGLYVSGSSPTLENLLVEANELPEASVISSGYDTYYYSSMGGGICLLGSGSELTGVDVWLNYADQGGGVYVDEDSTITFEQGWIAANEATDGAGFQVDGGVVDFANVASLFNDATDEGGGLLVLDGAADLVNSSYAGDDAATGGGLYAAGTTTALTALNSIVYGAAAGEGVLVDSGSTFSGSYNDVYGNGGGNYSGTTDPTGSSGNISRDPTFTTFTDDGDPTDDDLTLLTGSPCINTGNPSAAYNDADGSRNDMGAFGGPASEWDL